jgi:hypothetical protein
MNGNWRARPQTDPCCLTICQNHTSNYHIFYHLLAGADESLLQKWQLKDAASYAYLNAGKCTTVPSIDDAERFQDVTAAFAVIGVSEARLLSVWRVLAAILHLGELKFAKGGDATKLAEPAAATSAAAALGMTVDALSAALVVRTITVRGQTTRIPLSPQEARDGADALAKALYDRLFKWLVKTMNDKLSQDLARSNSYIGILDIFGFENFKVNSFEQLNINYANEKLQQQFNHALFELEQREYVAEGVQWNMVEFADGRDCVELIEDKRGIIALLDEQCRLQQSTDATLIDKLHEQLASRGKYVKPRLARGEFGVRHYAGEVSYQVAGFIDKNRDTLPRHFLPLLLASEDKLIGHLFAGESDDADAQARQTVGGVFKKQLADLMAQLATTHCSYIRCLKPNADKAPEQFVGTLVAEQLRYSGMLETIRIRKLGYGRRFVFADFAARYAVMLTPAERGKAGDVRALSQAVFSSAAMRGAKVPVADAHLIGKTKVFVRDSLMFDLDKARDTAVTSRVVVIQAWWRARRQRRRFVALRAASVKAQALWRARRQRRAYDRMVRAAITLQSFARQIKAREQLKQLKRTKELAVRVQTAARAMLMRKTYSVLLDVKRTRERMEREAREKAERDKAAAEAARVAAEERARKEREVAEARAKAEAERARAEAERARAQADAEAAAAEGARRAELERVARAKQSEADAAAARAEAEALAAAKAAEARAVAAAGESALLSSGDVRELERLRALEASAVAAAATQIGDASAKAEAAEVQRKADRKAAKAAAKRVEAEKAALSEKAASAAAESMKARKQALAVALAPPRLRKKVALGASQFLTSASEARAAAAAQNEAGTLRSKVSTLMRKATLRKADAGAPTTSGSAATAAATSSRSRSSSFGARGQSGAGSSNATLRVQGGTLRVMSGDPAATSRGASGASSLRTLSGESEEIGDVRATSDSPIWIEMQPGRPRQEGFEPLKATWQAHCVMSYAEVTQKQMLRKKTLTFKERMAWSATLEAPLLSAVSADETPVAFEIFKLINEFTGVDAKGRTAAASGVIGTTLAQIVAAQQAIALAWDATTLRNELYCQVAKQIVQCPDPLGSLRGWQLMACCCAAFAPSGTLYDAVFDFLTNDTYSKTLSSDVSCESVARVCASLLRRTAQRGGRALVLTRLEIGVLTSLGNKQLGTDAVVDELHVPIKVYLDDHESIQLSFAPDTTAAELLRAALVALHFTPAAAESNEYGYAVFERAGRLERSLGASERVGDVMSKWEAYHKMASDRRITVGDMKLVIRRRLWLELGSGAWPSRDQSIATALAKARRGDRERAVTQLNESRDASAKKRAEIAKVVVDSAAVERQVDADRRLSFIAARRLVQIGAVHCTPRDAVLLTTLSLAYEAHLNPTGKVVMREHVPSTSYHLFGQKEWAQFVEEQSMLVPVTKSVSDVVDLYMAHVTRLVGSGWTATTFDGLTQPPTSPWAISAPVLSLRISAVGIELRADDTARDVTPLWRMPWTFVETWERIDETEFKLTFGDDRLKGPPLQLRSAQAPEIVSLLDAYYKALIVFPRFARARRAVTASDEATAAELADDGSTLPLLLLEKGDDVAVVELRHNAVFWLCERVGGNGVRGRVPRAALQALFDDPRLLPDDAIVAIEEDDAAATAASLRTNMQLSDTEREYVTGQRAASQSALDDDDEDSSSLSESGGIKKRPKKMCIQCGKKAKLMIKFKGDNETSPVCRRCADEFKSQDGFASTSTQRDERDVAFEKFAASAMRKGGEALATCRWSMALPDGRSLMPLSDEVDAVTLFDSIKRAMGDNEAADAPLEAPLDELFSTTIEYVLSEDESLRDELYCQLMRQLSHNPNALSRRRGWLLFDVCSGAIAPKTLAVADAALEFVRRSPWRTSTPHTLHRLRSLTARAGDKRRRSRTNGPSALELDAARNNTLLPVDVYLAGERHVRVYVEPFATVEETRAQVIKVAELHQLPIEWELCEVERPRGLGDAKHWAPDDGYVVRQLAPESAVADALRRFQGVAAEHTKAAIEQMVRSGGIGGGGVDAATGRDSTLESGQQPTVYIALLRRVYYSLSERRRVLPTALAELRLEFVQAVQGVLSGRYSVRHGVAIELEALRLQAVLGDRTAHTDAAIRDSGLVGHLPPTALSAISSRTQLHRIAQLLMAWSAHAGRAPSVCMSQYLSLVKTHVRLFGSAFFAVVHKRLRGTNPKCWLAVNFDGVFLLLRDRVEDQKSLEWWRYDEFEYKSAPSSFHISWGSIQQPKRMFLDHAGAHEIARLCAVFEPGVPDERLAPPTINLYFSDGAVDFSAFGGLNSGPVGPPKPRRSFIGLEQSSSLASLMRPLTSLPPEPDVAPDEPSEPSDDNDDDDDDDDNDDDDDDNDGGVGKRAAAPAVTLTDAPSTENVAPPEPDDDDDDDNNNDNDDDDDDNDADDKVASSKSKATKKVRRRRHK